jgi:APA family basic amino acid/polyamine antiporter
MSKIWTKKPMSAFENDMKSSQLKRVLGKWSLTAIGIGAIIGGGIFVLTGTGAYYHAGPALALSFIIAGIACVFAALCYSEFASILPVEGSAYAYAYGTVGEIFAWIIGWGLILEYAMGSMTVAVSWSGYFNKLLKMFGLHLPDYLTSDPASYSGEGFSMNLPAFLIVIFVISILIKGTKEAAKANNLIVIMKVSAVLFVIIAGAFFINADNWNPFIPAATMVKEGENLKEAYGIQGIISGAAAIFFAYVGFDAVSTQAGEAINPKKDVPFAIIVSLLVCTGLYILASLF